MAASGGGAGARRTRAGKAAGRTKPKGAAKGGATAKGRTPSGAKGAKASAKAKSASPGKAKARPAATARPTAKAAPVAKVTAAAARGVAAFAADRGRTHLLDVPFTCFGAAHAAGARWEGAVKSWVWRGEALPEALLPYRALPYSLERWREDEINGARRGPSVPERNVVLHDHQAEGVSAILRARRIGRVGFGLADEVGLGKTITAWKALAMMPDVWTILIVCPISVAAHWRGTIAWLGDHGKRVCIVNYERLAKLFEAPEGEADLTKKGLARSGKVIPFDAVVWDESHRLKNPDALRTRFAERINAKVSFRLWLSATLGQTPLELSYLSRLMAQMTGERVSDLKEYEAWCRDHQLGVSRVKFGKWVWSGAREDLERMRKLLFGGAIPACLRRTPQDIAGWPEIERIPTPVELDPEAGALYFAAWQEFREALALERRPGKENANGLVARLRFRQKSSLLRIGSTVGHVQTLRESGHQVAVSVAFIETLEAMRADLEAKGEACAIIYGGMDPAEKEAQRLAFQRGERRVCLFTVEEGISLHQGEHNDAPRSQIIHDLRWSGIQMSQIEGRTHRDGKFSRNYWLFGADTIEQDIAGIVAGRIVALKTMVGDDTETMRAIEARLREAA